MKKNKIIREHKKLGELIASSLVVTLLMRLAAAIYRKLDSGFFGFLFTSYDSENEAAGKSAALGIFKRADESGNIIHSFKFNIAKSIEQSRIINAIKSLGRELLACQVRVYGLFIFSFALYAAFTYIFKAFFVLNGEEDTDIGLIVTLVLMLIASVALISARCTLAEALLGSSASCFFLFSVVGLRRESIENVGSNEGRFNIAFIAGIIFGCASYLVSPLFLLLGIVGIIAAILVLISPEFGVLAIMTALPFAPTMGLVALVLYTGVCLLIKVVCCKRSIRFDFLDSIVLFFMLLMIFGGIVSTSSGSIKPMLVYVAFMVGYFLVVNLIRSQIWMNRCIIGVVTSCTLVALYGIFQNFFGVADTTWQDVDLFSSIKGRVVSSFENPNVLAEYLIMVLPLMLALFIIVKRPKQKLAMVICGIVSFGCLIYTWSRGAWLGFMIGIIIFMLMYSKKTLAAMMFGVLGIPFLPFVLPESIMQRFMSIGNLGDSSTSYRVNIWRGVVAMLKDYYVTGIGIGNPAFKSVYPAYSLSAIESAPHAHNLYLQILVEIGIVGLIVFLALLIVWTQSCLTLHASESRETKLCSAAIFCGIISVLAQGMTDYIWYNYRVFLMFWLMLGLSAAIRKIHKYTSNGEIF